MYDPAVNAAQFRKFCCKMYMKIAGKVGWEIKKRGECHTTGLLRSLVVPRMGLYGHKPVIHQACGIFDAFCKSGYEMKVNPDLKLGILFYCIICER